MRETVEREGERREEEEEDGGPRSRPTRYETLNFVWKLTLIMELNGSMEL